MEQILQEQGRLADQLYECACQMEHALIENDLDELKKTIENEEDLTGSFAEREGRRQKAALSLGKMLGLQKQEASLLEISEGLEDEELKNRLQQAGKYVAKSISRIQHKNFTVRKMLMLRNEYTDTLLRLITGNTDAENYGYGMRGQIVESGNPDHGMYEVLI